MDISAVPMCKGIMRSQPLFGKQMGEKGQKSNCWRKGFRVPTGNSVVAFLFVAFLSDSEPAKLTKERLKGHRQLRTFFTDLVDSTSYYVML
jgi:hypothetical protein